MTNRDPMSAQNYVDVTVLGAGGADLPRLVHVEIKNDGQEMQGSYYKDGYADSKGHITFSSLPDGSYRLTASAPGYLPQRMEVRFSHGERQEARLEIAPAVDAVEYTPDAGSVSVEWLSVPEKARKIFGKAHERYLKQDFNGSIKLLKQALEIDSNFAYAYNELGLDYWNLQRIPEAKEAFERAIATDGKSLQAPLNLADMLVSQKQYAEAARTLQQAAEKHPDRGEPYYLIAKLHFEMGNMDRAEKACQEALKRDVSRIPEVHILLSNIYIRRQDAPKVSEELQAYLAAAPQGHYAKAVRQNLDKIKQEQAGGGATATGATASSGAGDAPRN